MLVRTKKVLDDKYGRTMNVTSVRSKFSSFIKEKDGTKCTISMEKEGTWEKCQLSIFNLGTIMLSRLKKIMTLKQLKRLLL